MPFKIARHIILLALSLSLFSCRNSPNSEPEVETQVRKELVIYCENSMMGLIIGLIEPFEKKYNCSVRLQNDCAQNLMSLISYTGKGDIYLPASTATFEAFYHTTGQALMDSLFIGYNELVFMVKKGNPKSFDGRFRSLLNKEKHSFVLANPESSSLGAETRRLLARQYLYRRVLSNTVALTTDSRGLIQAIKANQADVVIDWKSNWYVNGNRHHVDIVTPKTDLDLNVPIVAATLSCSTEPALTSAFLQFAKAELNETLLSKYGFAIRKTIIF